MVFSSSNKLSLITKEIDIARCKGQWNVIPDLARRYKKYNPDGTAFQQTILAEAALIEINKTSPQDSKQVQHIEKQLENILQENNIKDQELEDSAKIILARVYFENKKYNDALLLLENLMFDKNYTGYKFILHYQSMAIKALCLEMIGDMESCLETYEYISTLLDDKPNISDTTLIDWAEATLYHANILFHKNNFSFTVDTAYKLNLLRSYHKTTYYQPLSKFLYRRMEITMQFIKYISLLYRNGEYILPPDATTISISADGYNDTEYEKRYFLDEIIQLYTIYENMLYHYISQSSLSPLTINDSLHEFVNTLAEDLDIILETTDDLYGFKEFIERVSEKASHSPSLNKYLFTTLVQLGELEEAQLVLQSYLQSCGHMTYEWQEHCKTGNTIIQDLQGELMTEPSIRSLTMDSDKTKEIHQDGKDHYESIKNQLNVIIMAIEMYCKDLSKPSQAVELAELAISIIDKNSSFIQPQFMSKIYTTAGISYGILATQIVDKEERPSYYEKALSLLQKSLELTPESWETYYHLAFQHADMCNIDLAIQCIRKSLEINSNHLLSWHLLVLLLSCPGQDDIAKSLEVATMGLQLANEYNNSITITADQHEQYYLLKLTQIMLLNKQEGTEAAIKELLLFFNQYGNWIGSEIDLEKMNSLYNVPHFNENDSSSWFAQLLYNSLKKRNKIPRNLVLSDSYDNINSSTTASSPTSSITIQMNNNNKSFQHRSISSNTISYDKTNNNDFNDSTDNYAKSIFTIKSDHHHHQQKYLSPSTKRNSTLRKYSSNSMLKSNNNNSNGHSNSHWQSIHLFPSRSASKHSGKQYDYKDRENTTFPIYVNESKSNDSFNRKSILINEKASSLHNFNQSIHNESSKGTPSIYSAISGSLMSSSQVYPTILTPRKSQHLRYEYTTTKQYIQYQKHKKFLSELWILTATWFKDLNQLDETMKAIFEAELIAPELPNVWCFLGEIRSIRSEDYPHAKRLFKKGLLLEPHHIGCQIGLAKIYLEDGEKDLAEGILTSITQGLGWKSAEAWYLLGQLLRQSNQLEQAKSNLLYALDLDASRSIQPFSILSRFI